MNTIELKTESVVRVMFTICLILGALFGLIALGLGLIFLTLQQAVGLALLVTAGGALFGLLYCARRITRNIIETAQAMVAEQNAKRPQEFFGALNAHATAIQTLIESNTKRSYADLDQAARRLRRLSSLADSLKDQQLTA